MLSADISRWRIGSLFGDFACATSCVPRERQRSLGREISKIYSTDFAGDSP
jgi:hypothetical protein